MGKKKAPAKVTGGAGFRYEDHIAARFLLDVLGGTNSLGQDFGRITRVDWQARESGWLADDLAVSCTVAGADKSAGMSIKSDRQVKASGFPENFVEVAWTQWLGQGTERKIREGIDCVVLVTGRLANEVADAWSKTNSEALQTTPERMLARLAAPPDNDEGSQSSAMQRTLFESFRCPEALRACGDTGDLAAVRLIRHVRLLHFDYESTASRDRVRAIIDCQGVLRSGDSAEAADLWDRLIGLAAEKRATGGSADLAELLNGLRDRFVLRDHPDYRSDWESLVRISQEAMADIHTEIVGLTPLPREDERKRIETRLCDKASCFLVGESGSGKSALAKTLTARYERAIWLTEDVFDGESLAHLEARLRLRHPLAEVLRASPRPCLVVFDGIEGYSEQALRLAGRLIREVQTGADPAQVNMLLVAQLEASRRIVMRLTEYRVPLAVLDIMAIERPSENAIRDLIASLPQIRWTTLRPELRPILTNLKILDWVVAAARAGADLDDRSVVGLTTLIDRLWERWVEGNDRGFARSHFLMRLSMLEAETLVAGVPRTRFEHAEQHVLRELCTSDLVRLRDEHVRFSHDLLGDWARMRVLLAEQPTASPADRDRAATPRWHRAVCLFGQRFLEQSVDGASQWHQSIERSEDGTDAGNIVRDLLLEAVFLATNARQLMEQVWSVRVAQEGRLLNRLLDRFLFVATLPDPRLLDIAETPGQAARLEHAFRVPFVPFWGPMLVVLHAHREDVAKLAPLMAARACSLWLKTMPLEWEPGRPMPWRRHAAELAVAIAREIEGRKAEGDYFSDGEDRTAYEAALYAAEDVPAAVAALCLELAKRRDLSPEARVRLERAEREGAEANLKWRQENPKRAAESDILCTPLFPVGPLRKPWPDGPRERVEEAFQAACLETQAFASLVRACPDVALEVLLAVCIEEPKHEDRYEFSHTGDCGIEHWHNGYPPLYSRGPFLPFLRQAPEHGLTFVLRLVNFATRRNVATEPHRLARMGLDEQVADLGVMITINGFVRPWHGDARTFRWHDWPHDATAISCALMALERWLYEQLDAGADIEPWLARILAESESLAFAGLLLEIGKRSPRLFAGVLQPLLREWNLYHLDLQVTIERSGQSAGLLGWGMQSPKVAALAREWYGMPHRRRYFRDIVTVMMLTQKELRPVFEEIRTSWRAQLDGDGKPETLRLLIERFSPENYTETPQDGGIRYIFAWPEDIPRRHDTEQRDADDQSRLMMFPFQCRQRLDKMYR